MGTTGYCMGGAISLTAAGTYPDRVAAAASFHGGNLATDSELSPHRLAPRIAARVYVAGADHDDSYPPEMAALTRAGAQRRRRGSPLRDLSRGAARLDDDGLPGLQRGRRRTPLGRAGGPSSLARSPECIGPRRSLGPDRPAPGTASGADQCLEKSGCDQRAGDRGEE